MAHSFVVARFLPQPSAQWTSPYGIEKAADIPTRPFLALRIYAKDMGYSDRPEHAHLSMLFIVSPEKPVGASKDCFFTLASAAETTDRVLAVTPPLSSNERPFYLYTFPKLFADYTVSDFDVSGDRFSGPHKLDESDFKIFCKSILEDDLRRKVKLRSSGGNDAIKNAWNTNSGEGATGTEYQPKPRSCVYELLDWRDSLLLAHPSIYNERLLYEQLASDYSWEGTTTTLSWLKEARAATCRRDVVLHLTNDSEVGIRGKEAMRLHSMHVPFNGDPLDEEESGVASDWDDEPEPDVQQLPNPQYANPAIDVKVVVFDILGTIFDREGSIRDALISLAPLDWERRTSRQLIEIYIEREALRLREAPDASYATIARTALTDTCQHLAVSPDKESLDRAIEIILTPRLRVDAIDAIDALRKRGCTLLGIPSLDVTTFSQYFEPHIPPELTIDIPRSAWASPHAQNPAILPEILQRSRCIHPDIKPTQILIVTTGLFRMVEPACTAGFPAVLLQTASGLESNVILDTATPTLIIHHLSALSPALDGPELSKPTTVPADRPSHLFPPYRVCDHYQVTRTIGSGSFSTVFSAFHVLTGEKVAIKREMPKMGQPGEGQSLPSGESTSIRDKVSKAEEQCLLPYEVQVYRQLRGYQAIPSLHHFEMYGGGYFLILDQVGVTLEQIRQVCRGTLSLRTVAMLALEAIDRIGFVHSRGLILRDVKPKNLAMGRGNRSNLLYMFDFGLAKLFINPATGEHIPFRTGLISVGASRYVSYNVHFGREPSRRDDMEALGNCLLYLFHGRLPWQGIYASNLHVGEMKAGKPFRDLLARSPPEFTAYFDHCRSLAFEEGPDYALLRGIFQKKMDVEGWDVHGKYDWEDPRDLEKGTLLPVEYKVDVRFVQGDLTW